MKRLTILAMAAIALFATAAVALAQVPALSVNVTGGISPSKGGTKKKPKNAKVALKFAANAESRTTVSTMTFFIPKDVKLSGKGFKSCTADQINAAGPSDSVCPKGSKLGSGTATALLGPTQSPLQFTTLVYAGGKNAITLYLQGSGGNSVNIAFPGPISKAPKPYGQKITVDIPVRVQQPVPGLYSYITGVSATIGGKATKGKGKKKKTYYFASLTGCSGKKHVTGVQLASTVNDAHPAAGVSPIFTDSSRCKK